MSKWGLELLEILKLLRILDSNGFRKAKKLLKRLPIYNNPYCSSIRLRLVDLRSRNEGIERAVDSTTCDISCDIVYVLIQREINKLKIKEFLKVNYFYTVL